MIQTQPPIKNLYIGIMSGTSVDAIDIVAIEIEDNDFSFVGGVNFEFPNHLRTKILEITRQEGEQDSKIIAELDNELGCEYANAVNQLLRTYEIKKEKVNAIGLHGQTIAHHPNATAPKSIQIGDAKLVAQKTEIICVSDYIRRCFLDGCLLDDRLFLRGFGRLFNCFCFLSGFYCLRRFLRRFLLFCHAGPPSGMSPYVRRSVSVVLPVYQFECTLAHPLSDEASNGLNFYSQSFRYAPCSFKCAP